MTRNEAKAFIRSLVILRAEATDEQALHASTLFPQWKANVDYILGDRVLYENILYKVLIAHTSQESWEPPNAPSLFTKILIPDEDIIYPWEQPDSTNAYMTGDKVTHHEKIWVSVVDNNVWEPGVYGWEEV